MYPPLCKLALFCAFTTSCFSALQAQSSYNITVKSGELRQSFSGFGTSQSGQWPMTGQPQRNTMADMVYGDLKMNSFRLWAVADNTQTVASMLATFNANYIASGAIADVQSRGVTTLLLAPCAVASAPSPMSAYGEKLAEFILQLKNTYGVIINVTGIQNEPSGWSTASLVDCVNCLRASLDARGLTDVEIIAPEQSSPAASVPVVDAMYQNGAAWDAILGIASHSYGTVLLNDAMEIRKTEKEWWSTEASDSSIQLEAAGDDNRAASVLGRFLCEMNHGVDRWFFFLGLGQTNNLATYAGSTGYLMLYDVKTTSIVPFLKYYYFKQALSTFDVNGIFRKCVSATEGDMFNSNGQNPAINAAAIYNPDGSWGISVVNTTGVTGSPASSNNFFYTATSYNVTITVEELASTPSKSFTLYRSKLGSNFVNSGTVTLINGVGTVTVGSKELVSLRSAGSSPAVPPVPSGLAAVATPNVPAALSWHATMGATSWIVKRATTSGGPYTTIGTSVTTYFEDTTAVAGSTYYYVVSATNSVGASANSSYVTSPGVYGWRNMDVGTVGLAGSHSISGGGVFTIAGAGATVGGTADALNYSYVNASGDATFVARLASAPTPSNLWPKVGLMMRESVNTQSAAVGVLYDFSSGKARIYTRVSNSASGSYITGPSMTVPQWFKLVRSGNTFMGYVSTNGTNWTLVGTTAASLFSEYYVGMFVSSQKATQLYTATFDNVNPPLGAPLGLRAAASTGQVKLDWASCYGATTYDVKRSTASGGPYTTIASPMTNTYTDTSASPGVNYFYVVSAVNAGGSSQDSPELFAWQNLDIGTAGLAGNIQMANDGSVIATAAGTDIGGTGDSCGFSYINMTGNGTLVARLTTAAIIAGQWPKVGLMMRESLSGNARTVSVMYDLSSSFLKARYMTRSSVGGTTSFATGPTMSPPQWFKLQRVGNVFTGYVSANGTTWTSVGSSTVAMNNAIYAGLAVSSRNTGILFSASFDSITLAP